MPRQLGRRSLRPRSRGSCRWRCRPPGSSSRQSCRLRSHRLRCRTRCPCPSPSGGGGPRASRGRDARLAREHQVMKRIVYPAVVGLALAVLQPAARGEAPWPLFDGCRWSFPCVHDLWRQRQCWAADDYCPKKLPCAPPCVGGCVDDYCRKRPPCVSPAPLGCVDDYCPKHCPILLGGACEPAYGYGPPENCQKCAGLSRR
jgi:hypothetical protein